MAPSAFLLNLRWRRWALGLAIVLALYATLGFWAVPKIITQQVPRWVQTELKRQASIGEVSFNPFTLQLRVADLKITEADAAPLFSLGELAVEMQWRSIVRRAWSFAEIRLSQPSAHLTVAPDGKFNIAELLATLAQRPHRDDSGEGLPRLIVEQFALAQGRLDMQDRRAGYANVLSPIEFTLAHFSTLPDQSDSYIFAARSASGGVLRWKGTASVSPIRGSGELTLENAALPQLGVYLKSYTQASVAGGVVSASVPYNFSYADGKFEARLAGVRASLRDLVLSDESVQPALKLSAGEASVQLNLIATQTGKQFQLTVADAQVAMSDLLLGSGARTPYKLAKLGFSEGSMDLNAHRAAVGSLFAEGAQLQVSRDREGRLDLPRMSPTAAGVPVATAAATAASTPGSPWKFVARTVQLTKSAAEIADAATGIKVHLEDANVKLDGASSDLTQPVKFDASVKLREGGDFAANGSIVPSSAALQADVRLRQIALAPLQPVLAQYLKLKIARGNASAQGRLTTGELRATGAKPALRYVGAFNVADLTLNENGGDLFAAWKNAATDKLVVSFNPNLVDIPELRVLEANAKLIIENDRSINASRLLVKPSATAPATSTSTSTPTSAAPATEDLFPVHVRRLRLQSARLEFADLSLRPQFGANIYELNGAVTGLSSNRQSRSIVELDGRVDEFGSARVRGELNPFSPRNNTDLNVVFKNVDMVSVSPYTMKFAGYRVAEGKISLDLQYKVRSSQLEGTNQIVLDQLVLGERVDSPNAMKLPLELAIALLKDSDGRINLGLPISGNIDDPQFSYGDLVWKAVGNVLTRIVTAPFRALGALLGVSGEKLESIDFDAGSAKLLPPEREKIRQVAQILTKRAQLKLSVPGQYSETGDGTALRVRAVRSEIARRAGVQLEPGDEPPPVDLGDRAVRRALQTLYSERFGEAELDKQKKAAEAAAPASPVATGASASASSASASSAGTTASALPILQRVGKMVQGEPQVADADAFYAALQQRLNQSQPLAPDALTQLGTQRADTIIAALRETGVDPARASTAPPEKVASEVGKVVQLKLGLAAK